MDNKTIIDSFITEQQKKNQPEKGNISTRKFSLFYFLKKLKRLYWKFKHTFKCEEKYMTEKALIRICHKCDRWTIENKELRDAFKAGGFKGLFDKKKELIAKGRLK